MAVYDLDFIRSQQPRGRADVRRICREMGWSGAEEAFMRLRDGEVIAAAIDVSFPTSPVPRVEIDTIATDDPVLVFSDLHIPSHDAPLMERMVRRATAEGCRQWIAAGDITDSGQFHPRQSRHRSTRTWQEDVELTREVLGELCRHVPRGYLFFGNHDAWLGHLTKGQIDHSWLYEHLFPDMDITFSSIQQVELLQKERRFRIVHGANYSGANPSGVAKALAQKYGCSIVMGHQHQAEDAMVGPYQAIVAGGVYDPARLGYVHEAPRMTPLMQQGFVIVSGGWARLYRPEDRSW